MTVKVHDLVPKLGVRYMHHIANNSLCGAGSPVAFTHADDITERHAILRRARSASERKALQIKAASPSVLL